MEILQSKNKENGRVFILIVFVTMTQLFTSHKMTDITMWASMQVNLS